MSHRMAYGWSESLLICVYRPRKASRPPPPMLLIAGAPSQLVPLMTPRWKSVLPRSELAEIGRLLRSDPAETGRSAA